jgi:hypothetical protein
MNPILVLAILAICTMPAYAQGQQPDTAKLKADAENMVKIVSGDKLKIQTYCEILDLQLSAKIERRANVSCRSAAGGARGLDSKPA